MIQKRFPTLLKNLTASPMPMRPTWRPSLGCTGVLSTPDVMVTPDQTLGGIARIT